MVKMMEFELFGRYIVGAFLRLNQKTWFALPSRVTRFRIVIAYGKWLHAIACKRRIRGFHFFTSFLRNRPQLELAARIADQKDKGSELSIAILACSIGAEVYSVMWAIRSHRPDLRITMHAVDVSSDAVAFAKNGVYTPVLGDFTDAPMVETLTAREKAELFDIDGDQLSVKPWLREGIKWCVGDASDPGLVDKLGRQDMVFVNNLLCHMYPPDAERCLANIAKLVSPGGHLFVSGVDLDVRTKVVRELELQPVADLREAIHNGDRTLVKDWPFQYWGVEPFNTKRYDWKIRYSTAFRANEPDRIGSATPLKAPLSVPEHERCSEPSDHADSEDDNVKA